MSAEEPAPVIQLAIASMRAGRWDHALTVLSMLSQTEPRNADARHLFGVTLRRFGDLASAERELRAAIALDKRRSAFHTELGLLLAHIGRVPEAERSLRAALALDRRFVSAVLPLVDILCAAGRGAEAVQLTTPLVAAAMVEEAVLAAHATSLKAVGREAERLSTCQRAVVAFPTSAIAQHNAAEALGDQGLHAEAEAAIRCAFDKGLDAPETWLLLGRALQGQDLFEPAREAFQEAVRRRPAYAMAHAELGQLIWMQSEDVTAATALIDDAIAAHPADPYLSLVKSSILHYADDDIGAYAALQAAAARADAPTDVQVAAARIALRLDPNLALAYARAAVVNAGPGEDASEMALCEALLASGHPEEAAQVVGGLRTRRPLDQHVLAYQATTWRLLDDPRYGELYDYAAFVKPWRIDAPPGWPSLEAYLADLKASLTLLHGLRAHPIGQSLRSGTQTSQNMKALDDPVIRAFFQAIDGPIRQHLAMLGEGRDPLRSRNLGGYEIAGIWSAQLRPGQGRHVDHVHQSGWLSSACYIDLPDVVEQGGQEGWIQFGAPGTPTSPTLGPEHTVKPEPGMLVLFPSYMWHGTIPFSGSKSRLTVAFDLIPAR